MVITAGKGSAVLTSEAAGIRLPLKGQRFLATACSGCFSARALPGHYVAWKRPLQCVLDSPQSLRSLETVQDRLMSLQPQNTEEFATGSIGEC